MKTLALKDFQVYSVKWLRRRRVAFLCHEPGLGKTAISVMSVVGGAVVVCPRFLIGVWEEELMKFRPNAKAMVVECEEDLSQALSSNVQFILMSYHRFVKLHIQSCLNRTFLLDEAHAFKSFESKRTQQAINVISEARKVVAITGTPVLNRPIELFPMLSAFGITRMNYWQFGFKYCAGHKTKYGFDFNGHSNISELQRKLSDCMIRFTKAQVAPELKPKIFKVIPLRVGRLPKQELEYSLEYILSLPLDVAFETMSLALKIHAELKFPQVVEYIEWRLNYDHKLVIFAHHREQMTLPLFEKFQNFNPVMVIGGMGHEQIKINVNKFQNDPTCRIIIVSIMAGGVGLTLNAASRAVFAEAAWSPLVIEQAADRLHRLTSKEQVRIDILTVQGSIDEYQIRRALEKLEIITQLVRETKMPTKQSAPETKVASVSQRLGEILDDLDALIGEVEELEALADEQEPEPEPEPQGRSRSRGGKTNKEDPPAGPAKRTRAGASNGKGNGKGPSFDDVREASAKLIDEFVEGREIVDEILKDMGYEPGKHKISALAESEYQDFVDRVNKELSA